ncbi:hypothetical protein HK104_006757 [Borealophlyctis nickersoniae]|nr:hypothetical protein HK104_006757 [Borealophlyctis nickersoniae]
MSANIPFTPKPKKNWGQLLPQTPRTPFLPQTPANLYAAVKPPPKLELKVAEPSTDAMYEGRVWYEELENKVYSPETKKAIIRHLEKDYKEETERLQRQLDAYEEVVRRIFRKNEARLPPNVGNMDMKTFCTLYDMNVKRANEATKKERNRLNLDNIRKSQFESETPSPSISVPLADDLFLDFDANLEASDFGELEENERKAAVKQFKVVREHLERLVPRLEKQM